MSRKTSTCTACLQEGHTRVSKDCPKYIPFWNKENEKELMELVDSYSEVIWEEVSEKIKEYKLKLKSLNLLQQNKVILSMLKLIRKMLRELWMMKKV
jgi:hypothetical protein